MSKPVLLVIDYSDHVLQTISKNLIDEYGDRFEVMQSDSCTAALEKLKILKIQDQEVALILVNQQMQQMSGEELLEQSLDIFPDAKRVLVTVQGNIKPVSTAKVDYYLPEIDNTAKGELYPALNDLLEMWQEKLMPSVEGIRLIGNRWSPKLYQIRDFLARNWVSYSWINIDSKEARCLIKWFFADDDVRAKPLVLFPDGSKLIDPSLEEIGAKIGLQMRAEKPFYDLIVIGGGPSGLAASIYGGSEGLRTLLIEREALGGQAGTAPQIDNYLGFPVGLSGDDLTRRAVAQTKKFGVEILIPQEVKSIRIDGLYRFVTLADGTEIGAYSILVATGVSYRKIGVPSIDQLTGAGVYYGVGKKPATCSDEDIFIIGAGNSAGEAALYLAERAKSVNIVVRGNTLKNKMSQYLIDLIDDTDNIKIWMNTNVIEAKGQNHLEALTLDNRLSGERITLDADMLFILIGSTPRSDCISKLLGQTPEGFIFTGASTQNSNSTGEGEYGHWKEERDPFLLESNVPGIFVAGDIREGSIKRVASAVGEGSVAVQLIQQYLELI
ncbi:MAG: FAD-dependent oxidoreductase [Cyanobacteria bacterium P01_A01_bin.83]